MADDFEELLNGDRAVNYTFEAGRDEGDGLVNMARCEDLYSGDQQLVKQVELSLPTLGQLFWTVGSKQSLNQNCINCTEDVALITISRDKLKQDYTRLEKTVRFSGAVINENQTKCIL